MHAVKYHACWSRLLVKLSHIFSDVDAYINARPFQLRSHKRERVRASARWTRVARSLRETEEGSGAKHAWTRRVSFDCASTGGIALSRHSGGFCRRHNSDDSHAAHGFFDRWWSFLLGRPLACIPARGRLQACVCTIAFTFLLDRGPFAGGPTGGGPTWFLSSSFALLLFRSALSIGSTIFRCTICTTSDD